MTMLSAGIRLLKGYFLWKHLCFRYHITNTTAVLFLAGENLKVDEYALKYLYHVMDRKKCDEALILSESIEQYQFAKNNIADMGNIKIAMISGNTINAIYDRYKTERFNKNLFFTYTDKTKDNLLGRFIRETDVNEKDAVCLAIYNLRTVLEEE